MIRFVLSLAALVIAAPAAANDPQLLERQLDQWLEWFPGRYDSGPQWLEQVRTELPEEERNYRRHSIFRQVDLPSFGEITFYAEQYRDGDPANVYRQRIYVITLDEAEQAIRLRVHVPKDQAKLLGAYRDMSLLEGLTPADTAVWEGCDLLWRWEGDQFRGSIKPGACRFQSPVYGEVVLEEYLILREREMHFADRGLSTEGEYLFGMRGAEPNIQMRVRPFSCALQREGTDRSEEEAIDHGLWLHDGDGLADLPREIGGTLHLLRSSRDDALHLTWKPREGGSIMASAFEDAEHIGLSTQDVSIRCRHRPERMYEDGRGG